MYSWDSVHRDGSVRKKKVSVNDDEISEIATPGITLAFTAIDTKRVKPQLTVTSLLKKLATTATDGFKSALFVRCATHERLLTEGAGVRAAIGSILQMLCFTASIVLDFLRYLLLRCITCVLQVVVCIWVTDISRP